MVKCFEWLERHPRTNMAIVFCLIGVAGAIAGPLEVVI